MTDKTLQFILDDSGANFVLCLPAFRPRVRPHLEVISLENCLSPRDRHVPPVFDHSVGKHELYVIYTSGEYRISCVDLFSMYQKLGTTGQPKGISISHRNVMNCPSSLLS